jgi:predicted RNase H-like HicB family nuclease
VEIIFEVSEDLIDGGYVAAAIGHGITTEADTIDDLRAMAREAVQCHFHDAAEKPKIIRLHFVRDEVLAL